ncbi:hypothetical protein [Bradyrhizobium sp. HKCCYLS20291]|uniref:hypothetical protein n=1 Tax=Bradyrhizobium sp. HKCCYLS20291 TaxID=3420766 RepID=UPI003EB89371
MLRFVVAVMIIAAITLGPTIGIAAAAAGMNAAPQKCSTDALFRDAEFVVGDAWRVYADLIG